LALIFVKQAFAIGGGIFINKEKFGMALYPLPSCRNAKAILINIKLVLARRNFCLFSKRRGEYIFIPIARNTIERQRIAKSLSSIKFIFKIHF